MRPKQKELNEFLLDFIEFLGKHFTSCFDKTKIAGGNEGLSVTIRNGKSDSGLEIDTDRARVTFRIAGVPRNFDKDADKNSLFSQVMADLVCIFENRLYPVIGYKEDKFLAGAFYRDVAEEEALADFKTLHPECDKVVVKKWTEKETGPGAPF
ncbi:MAG: hypothetical protein JWO30_2690 [Fibrobacteres bacterium]|nr:hypothetical protein [Fibrobacterota bacterium]